MSSNGHQKNTSMSNSRLSILYTFLALLALLSGTSTLSQEPPTSSPTAHKTSSKNASADQQMSTGVLAVQSRQNGDLFVDGEHIQPISPGNIITLKLTTGQHFVDLRDQKGNILWQKIVEVPVGAQAAVLIDTDTESPVKGSLPSGPTVPRVEHVTTTVPVVSGTHAVAIDTVANRIYVAGFETSITVIDGKTNATTSVPNGTVPAEIAINSTTHMVYVANRGSSDVTVIDGATNKVAKLPVGTHPESVAVNSKTNKIYVPNGDSDNVTVIDGQTNIMHAISVPKKPLAIAVNEATNTVYVTCLEGVAVIDGATDKVKTVIKNPRQDQLLMQLAVDQDKNRVYVGSGGMVPGYAGSVIDGASNTWRTLDVPSLAFVTSIAVNPITHKAYYANVVRRSKGEIGPDEIVVVDGRSEQIQKVIVGAFPCYIAVNSRTDKIYVTNFKSGTLTIIDGPTNTTTTIAVGKQPSRVVVNPVTNRIYVADEASRSMSVIE